MVELRCRSCQRVTRHEPFHTGYFKLDGHRVYSCRGCGKLRTKERNDIREPEVRHIRFNERLKTMRRHGFPDDYTPPDER